MNNHLKKKGTSSPANTTGQTFTNPLYEDPEPLTEFDSGSEFEDASELEDAPEFEDVSVQGRAPLRELQTELEHSKRGGHHLHEGNSDAFNAVTQAITAINTLMDSQKFGGEVSDDVQLLMVMENNYNNLLTYCNKYLHRYSATKAGKARKVIVQKINDLAQRDIDGLHIASDQIGKASKADRAAMTWDNLLQKSRSIKIQMTTRFEDGEKTTGGQVSDVTKLRSNNSQVIDTNGQSQALDGLKFFKPEEVINPEENPGKAALKKVMGNNPSLPDNIREILSHSFYSPKLGSFVDPVSRQRLNDSIVGSDIMSQLNKCLVSSTVMKDELLAPAGLNDVGSIEMSGRNVATSRIADLLGVGNLVARSELAEVTDVAGKMRKGIVMDAAKGKSFPEMQKMAEDNHTKGEYTDTSKNLVAPSFFRDISSLQALDIICGQIDRHVNNMFYQTDDSGRLTGVTGIDNDAAFGTNENSLTRLGEERHDRSVYDDDDNLVIPHLDKAFADKVQALSPSAITFALRGLVGETETKAAIIRLNKLKKAIANAAPGQLVEKEEDWNTAVQDEIIKANDTRAAANAAADTVDVPGKMRERYGVACAIVLPQETEEEQKIKAEATVYMDELSSLSRRKAGVAQNSGQNYALMLEGL